MSIIQDALKKAQEERAKKKNREVPYHRSDAQKKPKTPVYIILGLCIAAVIAYLYIPYFHKPKQVAQPVVSQAPVSAKPMQAAVNASPTPEAQKPARETPEKKIESTTAPALQKPIEKPVAPVMPNNEQEPTNAKTGVAHVQKIANSFPVKKKTKAAGSAGKQDTMNEPVRAVEKKTDDGIIDSMYNGALREQQSGRTKEAKGIYKQIVAKQPNHIEALNNLGVIAVQEGNTQEALFYFKKILEYQKNYSKAYNNIGLVAMKDGDRQLAEEYFRKAISIEPDSVEPCLNLSALLRSEGRLQEAAKLLEIPIQKKAKDPALFLSYAIIKDNLGQHEDAARYYRQYLSSINNPGSRKDVIERLKYIETKIITNDQMKTTTNDQITITK
jgi:tetratricopeptide (TPR) repeat protein